MKKNNQKRKLMYYLETFFFLLCSVLSLYELGRDFLYKVEWIKLLKDSVWLVLAIIVTIGSFLRAKDVGTSEDDDERDRYLTMKVDQQAYRITKVLLFVIGYGLFAWGMILSKSVGYNEQVMVIVIISAVLVGLWNLLLLIELILGLYNYLRK
ncbi:hypothetical protein SAMN04487792_1041 [Lactobacillus bombicola]|uniref:Uncharacterized protein n=2 Tax=Lactobacillus bombicola TaxID=1505723 RepID=A0A1I1SPB5_9LACO|nr:hypothetical protein [Lactobacillus bombicola]MCO6527581.1 hypothetical protein [Lactobacillus sp.]RHW53765.1 hypothetical protein DS835_06570 [Lactobacillus bombicola]SFD48287.1 hypothetical protein SAMN04487792_1041 [Lactobacillus bombicola]